MQTQHNIFYFKISLYYDIFVYTRFMMQQKHQYVRHYIILVITVDHGENVRARFTVTQNKWIKI